MKNPWLKKNPLMSLWLSGANAALGQARGRATAEARRQGAAATTQATRQVTDFWIQALGGKPPAQRRKKKA